MTDEQGAGGGADELAARSAAELQALVAAVGEVATARTLAASRSRILANALHAWQHPLADALDLVREADDAVLRACSDALDRLIAEGNYRRGRE